MRDMCYQQLLAICLQDWDAEHVRTAVRSGRCILLVVFAVIKRILHASRGKGIVFHLQSPDVLEEEPKCRCRPSSKRRLAVDFWNESDGYHRRRYCTYLWINESDMP